jgi:ketosteroid isomerase-like protein
MVATNSDIRELLDDWSAAVRAKDIDGLMSLYAPEIVYYDVVPPLQVVGFDAVRRNFLRWFDGWKSGIGTEFRDLKVHASEDAGFLHKLHRTSGTLKDGHAVAYWVRVTACCRRSVDGWLITHEHVSLPADFATGRVLRDLRP